MRDVRREMARVYRTVACGDLGSADGARLVWILQVIGRAITAEQEAAMSYSRVGPRSSNSGNDPCLDMLLARINAEELEERTSEDNQALALEAPTSLEVGQGGG